MPYQQGRGPDIGRIGDKPQDLEVAHKPNIFKYQDFRVYLSDLFAFRRRLDPKFNKSYVCKKMGLANSRSYFKAVLNGRVVSHTKVEDFIRTFELDKVEAKYFRVLVNFNQAMDYRDEREWYFEQLLALNGISNEPEGFDKDQDYRNVWYYPAICTVLGVADIGDDFDYLAYLIHPPITAKQAEHAVLRLSRMELIRKDEWGNWKPVKYSDLPRP
jgi:uncharacterized protein (TIGR02147 family)